MQVLLSVLVVLLQAAAPATPTASAPGAAGAPSQAAAGEAETPDPRAGLSAPVRDEEELLSLWRLRQKAVAGGDATRADDLEKQILTLRKELGIRRLDAHAVALMEEARVAAVEKGDLDRAQRIVEQARKLAPGLPDTESLQAEITFERQPWALHRWFVLTVKGWAARLDDFQRRALALSDAGLTTFVLLTLLLQVFLLSQLLRHGLALYHGLGRTFPGVVKFLLLGVALSLAVLPLLLGFGPLLLVFPFLVLVHPVQARSERVFAVFFALFLGATPWLLRAVDRLSEAGTGVSQALFEVGLDPTRARAEEVLVAHLRSHPTDWQASAALGLAQKRRGDLDAAVATLRQALAHVPAGSPESGLVRNNLGNALFAGGRVAEAERQFQQAIQALPKAPEPAFNLSRLYTRTTRLETAQASFAAASALDPDRVALWNEDVDLNLNRFVVDMDLPADLLTARELQSLLAPSPLAARAWHQIAGPVPELVAPAGCMATLVAFGLLSVGRRRLRVVLPCSRCAMAAEVDRSAPETAPLCEQCHNLFIRNIPVDRRIRFEKEERIARYRTFRQWGLRSASVVLPGLSSFLTGHPARGALVVGALVLIVLRLLLPDGVLFEPFSGAPPSGTRALVLLGLLALIWLGGVVRTWRDTRGVA